MKKANEKVLKILLEVHTAEIGAIGIYMDQHVKCADMGYEKLAEMLKKDAIDEMKHAEGLAERILFLGGAVNYQKHMVPDVEQKDIADMIKMNIRIELEAIDRLNASISSCFTEKDHGSRMLLEEILKDEERHLDELQVILENIQRYGDPYIITHLI